MGQVNALRNVLCWLDVLLNFLPKLPDFVKFAGKVFWPLEITWLVFLPRVLPRVTRNIVTPFKSTRNIVTPSKSTRNIVTPFKSLLEWVDWGLTMDIIISSFQYHPFSSNPTLFFPVSIFHMLSPALAYPKISCLGCKIWSHIKSNFLS